MHTLIIQHVPDSGPAQFQVVRPEDGKRTDPVGVAPPRGYAIEECPESDLMRELQWYLETFLEYPYPPETEHAERVQKTLRSWGEQAFEAVFGSRQSSRLFDDAVADGF